MDRDVIPDGRGRFVTAMALPADAPRDGYPFDLEVVECLRRPGGFELPAGATFLVGDNGSGKSTLVEALAVAVGLNAEGGSQNHRFATRDSESELGSHVTLTWGAQKPRSRFFLRAESFYNLATATEELGPDQLVTFGGHSPHERSHGESLLDLIGNRFTGRGLYVMDEPEAALSPRGAMSAITLMHDLVQQGSQLLVATHSPILLALPGATIFEVDGGDVEQVSFDDAMPVRRTRDFLRDPDRYLRHLTGD